MSKRRYTITSFDQSGRPFNFFTADANVLTSPDLTGEWEQKLRKIENNEMTREEFMNEISNLTKEFVSKTPVSAKLQMA